jgi:hypothetical protein
MTRLPSARETIAIALTTLLFMLPSLFGPGGVDLQQQSLWVRHFTTQFWGGDLYPRWFSGLFAGDGSPAFFYYPPLSYFITAFFAPLAHLDAFGYAQIAASAFLAMLISGFTAFLWLQSETGHRNAALMGSLLYIAVPAHIAQSFYYTLLFSSVWAYAWVPLLFLFTRRMAQEKPYGASGFAFSLFLLIMTSLPMTLLFAPLAAIHGLLLTPKGRRAMVAAKGIGAGLLGITLSAVYLLPAISYLSYANLDMYTNDNVPFVRFFFTVEGVDSLLRVLTFSSRGGFDVNRTLYIFYWCASFTLALVYFRAAHRKFFLTATLLALFLMLPLSNPLWEHLPLLKTLQISERFFAVSSLAFVLLAAKAWPQLKVSSWAVLTVCGIVTFAVAWGKHTSFEEYRDTHRLQYAQYAMDIEQYGHFLPTPDLMDRFGTLPGIEALKGDHEQVKVISGNASITVLSWQPRHIMLHYRATQASQLRVRQFDFPGWIATLGNTPLPLDRDAPTGRILLSVLAGEGDIRLDLEALLPEMAGKAVSIFSLVILLLITLAGIRRQTSSPEFAKQTIGRSTLS